ncbi:MAG: hypothetical protein V1738_02615 [Patescibacteria group bacterium]
MMLKIAIAVSVLLTTLFIGLLFKRREKRRNIAEANFLLEQARCLIRSSSLPNRRRAGTFAGRVIFLWQQRGLNLELIRTTEIELRRIVSIACAKPERTSLANFDSCALIETKTHPSFEVMVGETDETADYMLPLGETMFSVRTEGPVASETELTIRHELLSSDESAAINFDPTDVTACQTAVRRDIERELAKNGITNDDITSGLDVAFSQII